MRMSFLFSKSWVISLCICLRKTSSLFSLHRYLKTSFFLEGVRLSKAFVKLWAFNCSVIKAGAG